MFGLGKLFGFLRRAPAADQDKSKVRSTAPAKAPANPARRVVGGQGRDSVPPSADGEDPAASGAPRTRELAGIVFQEKLIETDIQLAEITFHQVINSEVRLMSHLYSQIAIAKLTSSEKDKEVILFVDTTSSKKISPDGLRAVVAHLKKRGYTLRASGVQAYTVIGGLVIGLSQGHLDPKMLTFEREVRRDPQRNALMDSFTQIVAWAYDQGADDIDWVIDETATKSQLAFKIGGKYIRPPRYFLPTETVHHLLGIAWQKSQGGAQVAFEIKSEQQANVLLNLPPTERAPNGSRVRLRWSGMSNDKGTVVTTRIQRLGDSAMIRSLDDAGYVKPQMDILRRAIHSEGGMIVFAGVVGSGKSTSLAALIKMLPRDQKIVSFEDPVELEMKDVYQKTIARDLTSTEKKSPAFQSATRALFRSALDVMYLGEIRDEETGLVARQIVESGHSVYTTTHARSALGIFDRLSSPAIDVPADVLATPGIVKLLVYQALLPTNCPHCAKSPEEYAIAKRLADRELAEHKAYFQRLERLYGIPSSYYRLRDPEGCQACRREELPELNGFLGRTVVSEMIEPDKQMLEYVLAKDKIQLEDYWRSRASSRFDDANLTGKTAMECAIFKAVRGRTDSSGNPCGSIDPREIEPRFKNFETVELEREADAQIAQFKAGKRPPPAPDEGEGTPIVVRPNGPAPLNGGAHLVPPAAGANQIQPVGSNPAH